MSKKGTSVPTMRELRAEISKRTGFNLDGDLSDFAEEIREKTRRAEENAAHFADLARETDQIKWDFFIARACWFGQEMKKGLDAGMSRDAVLKSNDWGLGQKMFHRWANIGMALNIDDAQFSLDATVVCNSKVLEADARRLLGLAPRKNRSRSSRPKGKEKRQDTVEVDGPGVLAARHQALARQHRHHWFEQCPRVASNPRGNRDQARMVYGMSTESVLARAQDNAQAIVASLPPLQSPGEVDGVMVKLQAARSRLVKDGTLWVDIGNFETDDRVVDIVGPFLSAMLSDGWVLRAEITWWPCYSDPDENGDVVPPSPRRLLRFSREQLPIYFPHAVEEPVATGSVRPLTNLWEVPADRGEGRVPAELATWCILLSTRPGDRVIDLFAGDGTAAMVALDLGRSIVAIEEDIAWEAEARETMCHFGGHEVKWHTPEAELRGGNRKSQKTADAVAAVVLSFDLPAYRSVTGLLTCPGALHCIRDCYARCSFNQKAKWRYEDNLSALMNAATLAESDDVPREDAYYGVLAAMVKVAVAKHPTKSIAIRLHSSGDFFEEDYLAAWLRVMSDFPSIEFYAYTKSVTMVSREVLPSNFHVTYSEGGKEDAMIPTGGSRSRIVAPDEMEAALAAGWVEGTGDDGDAPVINGESRIVLAWHGPNWNNLTPEKREKLALVHGENDARLREQEEATSSNPPLAAK